MLMYARLGVHVHGPARRQAVNAKYRLPERVSDFAKAGVAATNDENTRIRAACARCRCFSLLGRAFSRLRGVHA
eukprot:2548255-Pleurochrysis_carterae.AAC.2